MFNNFLVKKNLCLFLSFTNNKNVDKPGKSECWTDDVRKIAGGGWTRTADRRDPR